MVLGIFKGYKADKKYEEAHALFLRDQYKEAESLAMEILDNAPDHLDTLLLIAQIAWNQEHFQKSWEWYNKAVQTHTHAKKARLGRAQSSYNLYRFEDALDDYLTLYETSFKDTDFLVALGDVYQKLNLQTIALRYYEKAVVQSPNNIKAHIGLGYQHIILGAYKHASEHITQAKEIYYNDKKKYDPVVLENIEALDEQLRQLLGNTSTKKITKRKTSKRTKSSTRKTRKSTKSTK